MGSATASRPPPLQNRVTPFGEIVAVHSRGLFTGNRGIIHDPASRTLLRRRWTNKAWLICLCQFKGRRRAVMGTDGWTELFFLDEATALAAGHRPCFECRRADALRFRAAWADAAGLVPKARQIDEILHGERLQDGRKRLHPLPGDARELAAGAMISAADAAYLVVDGRARAWSAGGYGAPEPIPAGARLLTPPSTLAALSRGYRPVLHSSAVAA